MVIINHGNGVKTIYVHLLAKPMDGIKKGKHVDQGQLIGLMGTTGRSTGPHLHFGVWLEPQGRRSDQIHGHGPRRRSTGSRAAHVRPPIGAR